MEQLPGTLLYKIESSHCSIKGFCFRINNITETERICSDVYKLVKYMCQHNIPHNVYLTAEEDNAATAVDSTNDDKVNSISCLRVFIWPRENLRANKEVVPFNVAFCELSGYVPVGCKCKNYSKNLVSSLRVDLAN